MENSAFETILSFKTRRLKYPDTLRKGLRPSWFGSNLLMGLIIIIAQQVIYHYFPHYVKRPTGVLFLGIFCLGLDVFVYFYYYRWKSSQILRGSSGSFLLSLADESSMYVLDEKASYSIKYIPCKKRWYEEKVLDAPGDLVYRVLTLQMLGSNWYFHQAVPYVNEFPPVTARMKN